MDRLNILNLKEQRDSHIHVVNSKSTMTGKLYGFLIALLVGEKSENICQYLNFLYNNKKGKKILDNFAKTKLKGYERV